MFWMIEMQWWQNSDKKVTKMVTWNVDNPNKLILYLSLFTYFLLKSAIIYCMQVIWSDFHFFENFPKKWFGFRPIRRRDSRAYRELGPLPWLFFEISSPSLNRAKDSELDFYRSSYDFCPV